jgi:methyl-accepting chemotaxis protein
LRRGDDGRSLNAAASTIGRGTTEVQEGVGLISGCARAFGEIVEASNLTHQETASINAAATDLAHGLQRLSGGMAHDMSGMVDGYQTSAAIWGDASTAAWRRSSFLPHGSSG